MSEEVTAVGWDAIDQSLAKVYGDQEPYALWNDDPLFTRRTRPFRWDKCL